MSEIMPYSRYLVVFLDVLGQGDMLRKLRKFGKLSSTRSDDEEIRNIFQTTAGFITELRKDFGEIFDKFNEGRSVLEEYLHQLPADQRSSFEDMTRVEASYQGFSDSVIISVDLEKTQYDCASINGIYAAFVASCGMFTYSLTQQHALRGGLDMGLAVKIGENEVYGAALESAYELESEIAEYPRLVVGDNLVAYLNDLGKRIPKTFPDMCTRELANKCKKFLMHDSDGRITLDYLGKEFYESASWVMRGNAISTAYKYVREQYSYWNDVKDEKLIHKYQKLLNYFERRLPQWGVALY